MNIFSKWFGSKDKKEQKEEIAEEVYFIEDEPLVFDDPAPTEVHFNESESVQKVKDEKKSSEPNNLLEAIHFVVVNRGGDYLQSRGFINILSDYQVFKDFPAAKHIILNMQANGFIGKILQVSNWGIESKAIAAKYSTEFGAKEDIVLYLVQCIGYGLGYSNVILILLFLSLSSLQIIHLHTSPLSHHNLDLMILSRIWLIMIILHWTCWKIIVQIKI